MVATDPKAIVEAVRRAGVVGAGGGGFPTHVKLGARVDTVIANGSECEPLLGSDKAMMSQRPDLLVEGLLLAMKATGASKGWIAIKGHYREVVRRVEGALPKGSPVEVFRMDHYYPAGDEFLLVCDVTGRVIPEGGIPLDVGVVVSNAVTLMQVARAVQGVPVTSRAVTINGEVSSPGVVVAAVGTTYRDLVAAAGGSRVVGACVIDGGPMMGKVVDDLDVGIAKTTSGVVVLPGDHPVVRMKRRTVSQEIHLSRAACCQCFRCTDLCPRNLLGHELYPHMTMRAVNGRTPEPSAHVTSAFLCSQCGMCDMVACDIMRLSPRRMYAALRQRLAAAGVKNPHRRKGFSVRDPYRYRKTPLPQLLRKIGVERYDRPLEFRGELAVSRVRVPLARHAGAHARATVERGSRVALGDCIAEVEPEKLGACCHASIAGTVAQVTGDSVEIEAI